MYSISVVTPVYNEAKLIKKAIKKIDNFLSQNFENYEIIIVESGSTDGTYKFCEEIKKDNPKVKLVHEISRNGFGAAIKLGFNKAKKDLLWVITADIPFPLNSIKRALPLLKLHGCVLSYRSQDNRIIYRKIQSYFYNQLIKVCLQLKVRHINSGFKVYKKKHVRKFNIISNGWFFDAEIIYEIEKKGISYIEIPVQLIEYKNHKSSINLLTPFTMLIEMWTFLRLKRSKKFN